MEQNKWRHNYLLVMLKDIQQVIDKIRINLKF
jgi:hypothetical protein